MTTDLGVECMVGLCLAAAIWWIARRRRTHTEGPKTRLDPLGLAELEPLSATDDNTLKKDDLVVEDNSAQRNASGMPGKDLPLSPSPQQQEHKRADEVDNESDQESEEDKEEDESWDVEDEDDAAEPDLTDDEDEDEEREEAADEDEEEDEEENDEPRVVNAELDEVPLETLARVEALAAKMGVNMTESFMAMEEFLVLDAPPSPGALPSFETDRMRLEDHAVVPLSDAASDSEDEETDNNDDQPVDETKEEEEQERRASHDDNEQPLEDAAPDAEAAFWAKCENREECNLCHTPFTFLTRRHHCRKCFASVCGGCSANSAPLPEFGGRLERVCDTCWTSLQQQTQVTPAADEETVTTEEVHEHEAS